jgi:hypothetical protein
LLAINALLAVLFVISRLEPTQVKKLGPPGQYVYELINPPANPETSPLARRLIADVKALWGRGAQHGTESRVPGLIRRHRAFSYLKPLKALPRLGQLQITGCGLLDEEVISERVDC